MNSQNRYLAKYTSSFSAEELIRIPRLQHAFIRLNNRCNAKCYYCNIWQLDPLDYHHSIDFETLMDDIYTLDPNEINLHGGEVFLSKGYQKILSLGQGRAPFSITTNGLTLREKDIDEMVEKNVRKIYLSIDHCNPVKNAKFKRISWSSGDLYPIIKYIKQSHPLVTLIINHVVSAYNIKTLNKFLLRMKNLNVDAIHMIPIKDYPALYLSISQVAEYYRIVERLLAKGEIDVDLFLERRYRIFGNEQEWQDASRGVYNKSLKKRCSIPYAVLFLDAVTGNVYPCDTTMYRKNSEQYVLGNVLTESIIDIWHGGKFSDFRKKMNPLAMCRCIDSCDPTNVIN